jgi:VanZ family protein
MFQKLIVIAAWTSFAVIAYATLTNVAFVYLLYYNLVPVLIWPAMRNYVHFEHVIAFAIFGALFSIAYPRRIIFVCVVVFVTAGVLEYLQTLTPDRHGTLVDASEKVAGGLFGIFTVTAALYLWHRERSP